MYCVGPGQTYMPFVVMEDLLDKLKLLQYEEEFVAELRQVFYAQHHAAKQEGTKVVFVLQDATAEPALLCPADQSR